MGQKLGADIIKPLQYSAPNIILPSGSRITIGGQQYLLGSNLQVALSGLTANTLYFVYAQASLGVVSLTYLTSVPTANLTKKLVGAFYANGLSPVAFGSFVNIEGRPETERVPFTATLNLFGTGTTQSGWWVREGDRMKLRLRVTTGSAVGSQLQWQGPANLSPDRDKMNQTGYPYAGEATADAQGGILHPGKVLLEGVSGFSHNTYGSTGVTGTWGTNSPYTWAAGQDYDADCEYFIVGWTNTPLKDL